jgi:hypothetical protein
MTTKVYFANGGGRFGNQLINQMHFYAFEKAFDGVEVVNLAALDYYDYFSDPNLIFNTESLTAIDASVRQITQNVRKQSSFLSKVIFSTYIHFKTMMAQVMPSRSVLKSGDTHGFDPVDINIHHWDQISLDETASEHFQQFREVVLMGWPIRNWNLVFEMENDIKSAFNLRDKHFRPSREFTSRLRKKYKTIIGVNIRQTDYKDYQNGRFYYSTDQYLSWIKKLNDRYDDAGFIIASDEDQEMDNFPENCYLSPGNRRFGGHFLTDWGALSQCDIIACPPSTFSYTAGFLGDCRFIPLLPENNGKDWIQPLNKSEILEHPVVSTAVK